MNLNRNNFNLTATHSATLGAGAMNQLSAQYGRRQFTEPNNSQDIAEYFSSGNTLQTGANLVGDQNDTNHTVEIRDTFFKRFGSRALGAGREGRRLDSVRRVTSGTSRSTRATC